MKNSNRRYCNGEIVIYWRASLCVHNTACYRSLRSVFDPSKRPWVNPNGASSDEIKDVIEKCPTEALMFRWVDNNRNLSETSTKLYKGNEDEEFSGKDNDSTVVSLRPNGPVIIEGDCQVEYFGANIKFQKLYSLCRCGESRNMPFCDGRHFSIGYKDR